MATMFDDVEAICPYFIRSSKNKIVCEGMGEYEIGLEFDYSAERNLHRQKFCNTYDYGKCEICKLLDTKYNN